MFNDDQKDYMESLSRTPAEEKCWCGWYRVAGSGVPVCPHCPPGATAADRAKVQCPECRSFPGAPGLPLHHIITCSHNPGRQSYMDMIAAQNRSR